MFAKPGHMADTLLILALASLRSPWLFPMFMLSFSPNCWSRSWASQDLVWPFTLTLHMNAPKASWMTCAMHGIWFLNAGHTIPEASRVDCDSWVLQKFEEELVVVIPSKLPSVSLNWSKTFLTPTASLAAVCWPLTYHTHFVFKILKELAINLIQCGLCFSQCPISIHIVINDWQYGKFVPRCLPI